MHKKELEGAWKQIQEGKDRLSNFITELGQREKALEEREARVNSLVARVKKDSKAAKEKVKLNVGGTLFVTTKETLCKFEDTYFSAMLGNDNWEPGEDGSYFIDRDPFYFSRILSGFRVGKVNYQGLDRRGKQEMERELDFFILSDIFQPFDWSIKRIGPNLKVDRERRVLTAIGEASGDRIGILKKIFYSVEDLPDCISLQVFSESSKCTGMQVFPFGIT